jgi:DNA repair protein RadC
MADPEFDPFAPRPREKPLAEPAALALPSVPMSRIPVAAPPDRHGEDEPAAEPARRRTPATPNALDGSDLPTGVPLPEPARPPGYRLSVKEMAPDERPRERLKLRGSQSLSDGDLLAILLNTGIVGETVTDVAQRVVAEHGGLRGLLRMETAELARIRGIGDAKAVRLKAALEIGRRLSALGAEARPKITSPDDVATLLQVEMAMLEQEQLRVVLLDTKHQVIAIRTVVQGSVNQAQVRVAEVYRDAIRQNAVAIVAAHNHPSGDPTPSAADVALTVELVQAGALLDIELLDHLVLGQGRWVSLRRLGLGFPAGA